LKTYRVYYGIVSSDSFHRDIIIKEVVLNTTKLGKGFFKKIEAENQLQAIEKFYNFVEEIINGACEI